MPLVGATGPACCAREGRRIEESQKHHDCSRQGSSQASRRTFITRSRSDLISLKSRRRLNAPKPHEPPPLHRYLVQEPCPWQESNSSYSDCQYFASSSFRRASRNQPHLVTVVFVERQSERC